jgi:hypothetical protein
LTAIEAGDTLAKPSLSIFWGFLEEEDMQRFVLIAGAIAAALLAAADILPWKPM